MEVRCRCSSKSRDWGGYLPKYAGNLDIMTAAAARTAEMFVEEILAGKLKLESVEAAAA
jgi:acetaldehyde/propanal dehydrogenase